MGERGGPEGGRGLGQQEGSEPQIKGPEVSVEGVTQENAPDVVGDADGEALESPRQSTPKYSERDMQKPIEAPSQELGPQHAIFKSIFENLLRDNGDESFFTQATQALKRGVPFETICAQQETWLEDIFNQQSIPFALRDRFKTAMRQALDRAQAQHRKPFFEKLRERLFGGR